MWSAIVLSANLRWMLDKLAEPPIRRVDFAVWALRVATWDGVLPFCILIAPILVGHFFPNQPAALNWAAILATVVAFCVRGAIGLRQISRNNCSPGMRDDQYVLLVFGIFILAFFDCVGMFLHLVPNFSVLDYLLFYGLAFAVYLPFMAFAMYPGSKEVDVFR
jgi:hypothetical protein